MGLPVHAYLARDEIREDGTERSKKVFVNLPTEVRWRQRGAAGGSGPHREPLCVCGLRAVHFCAVHLSVWVEIKSDG
jgi:hypothetical protein